MRRSINDRQQSMHSASPLLPVLLKGAGEFSEMMGIAQGVDAVKAKIGLPVIMAQYAVKSCLLYTSDAADE